MITYDYTHDLALVMHAYYVNELDVGARAVERILDSNAPLHVQECAHQNQPFYLRPLSDFSIVDYKPLKIQPARDGWSLFNPSIIEYNGQTIVNVRSSNYQIVNKRYVMPPEDKGMIRTENLLAFLGGDGKVQKVQTLRIPEYQKTGYLVDGMEDVRLFVAGGKLMASGTVRNLAPFDWMCRIGLVEVFADGSTSPIMMVNEPVPGRHEKNWMPVSGAGEVKWLYDCGFHTQKTLVGTLNSESRLDMKEMASPQHARRFRGSSQLIPFQGQWLSVIHEVHDYHGTRVYSHRFVEFGDNFKITRFSDAFFLRESRCIEFCAGISVTGNSVHLSFGVHDSEAWLAKLPVFTVDRMLEAHHFAQ